MGGEGWHSMGGEGWHSDRNIFWGCYVKTVSLHAYRVPRVSALGALAGRWSDWAAEHIYFAPPMVRA